MAADFASCCLLSYNRPHLIRDTIATLLDAGAPLELIVHDDGSSDEELLDWLVEMQRAGAISTLILNPVGHNQGQGVALNRMFHMAKGDPIIKIDHDLHFRPGWLAEVNEILARNHDRAGDRYIGLLGLLHYHHDPVDSAKTLIDRNDGWTSHTHILGSAFAVRRECWEALGPFEEHSEAFAEDYMFQQAVTGSAEWSCGLPPEDLCVNVGMGYGPSTVNVEPGKTATIHREPLVIGR
jgi:glycosyltransferase involved in cell wall biosynthesis